MRVVVSLLSIVLRLLDPETAGLKLVVFYKASTSSFSTVRSGRLSLSVGIDDVSPKERQITATNNENIKKVHTMIMDDRRSEVYVTANTVGNSENRYILLEELNTRKLFARWIKHFLNTVFPVLKRFQPNL